MSLTQKLLIVLASTAVFSSVPAFGAMTSYINDRSAWLGAVSVESTVNFDNLAPVGSQTNYNTGSGYTAGNINFLGFYTDSNFSLVALNPSAAQSWLHWTDPDKPPTTYSGMLRGPVHNASYMGYVRMTIQTAGRTAVGFNLADFGNNSPTVLVRVNGVQEYYVPIPARPIEGFFGVTSDTAITKVEVFTPGIAGDYLLLDNVKYGTFTNPPPPVGGDVPEVATWLMMATGLLAISRTRRFFGRIA